MILKDIKEGRQMNRLHFLQAIPDAFIEHIFPIVKATNRPLIIVGNNDLAQGIVKQAAECKVHFEKVDSLDEKGVIPGSIIALTQVSEQALNQQLMSCVNLKGIRVVAPITDQHCTNNPLFLISIPKAGTHLLYELVKLLGYNAGVQFSGNPEGQTWYCLEYSNSHTRASDFFVDSVRRAPFGNRHHPFMTSPALFIYRHPLDILVSEAHYYHMDGKTSFAGGLNQDDFEKRVEYLMNDNWLLGSLRERIGAFLPWMDFPNVVSFSFEELIGTDGGGREDDQLKLIWSIMLKLQTPGDPNEIASVLFNSDSPTFRSAQIFKYTDCLSSGLINKFCTKNKDILGCLGYPIDGSPGLPSQRQDRLEKMIGFSKVDYSLMPLTIEPDFLECNLVRFGQRIYGIPKSAGPIDLTTLSENKLSALPSAEKIEDLKLMLTMGCPKFSRYKNKIIQYGTLLQEQEEDFSAGQFWKQFSNYEFVDSYKGYNLIAYQDEFLAIKHSIGVVDLVNDNYDDLTKLYGEQLIFKAENLFVLQIKIDNILLVEDLKKDTDAAIQQFQKRIEDLRKTEEELSKKVIALEKRVGGLRKQQDFSEHKNSMENIGKRDDF